jgi:dGTPase
VFVPHEHDHFRTRMTHTLEVAQIGRTCGRAMQLNEDLIEAVGLAHDLGHPPFGHAGEAVLNQLMANHGLFEHNRQSLRVVDYLEHPYPQFRGLNLCRVIRECLAKHQTRYDRPVCPEFDLTLAAPLEGQLVDLADEIAYTSADLEDALAAGWIDEDALAGQALWQRACAAAEAEAPGARPIHKRIRATKGVLAILADDVIATTQARIATLGITSPEAARRAGRRGAVRSEPTAAGLATLQQFLYEKVYMHPISRGHAERARRVIAELFVAYGRKPSELPERYRSRLDHDGLHRVVCDYIAGMTDRFCLKEHERLGR